MFRRASGCIPVIATAAIACSGGSAAPAHSDAGGGGSDGSPVQTWPSSGEAGLQDGDGTVAAHDAGDDVETADAETDTGTDARGDAASDARADTDAGTADASAHDAGTDAHADAMVVCTAPLTDCSGTCVNLLTNPVDCGACGLRCFARAPRCVNGCCQ
jgi:hypothetical protein